MRSISYETRPLLSENVFLFFLPHTLNVLCAFIFQRGSNVFAIVLLTEFRHLLFELYNTKPINLLKISG